MIIVLKQDAPDVQVREFCHELEGMGLQINDSKGSDTHILGLIGDTKAIAESWVLANPVLETCRRVSEPYKKANRKFHPDDSVIDVDGVKIGGGNFAVIAGPCSIESEEQITYCAQRVKAAGASLLRGGAFKPRTSPYSFQGMRSEGLDLLKLARRATGAPIVTEIMNTEHLPLFENVDLIQVGARNMQNFELLKAVGRQNKPVLLKRGLANTLEEFVMSAEYINTYGHQMLEVWGQNSELIEQKALRQLKDEQIDAIFEAVSLAIGNEVYEALCDLEDKIGQETGEDQSGIEEEILDFIKRDTAWACIERLLGEKGFFSRILEINQTGHWACSWVGKFPKGNFIIL